MKDLPPGWAWTTLGEICDKPQYGWTSSATDERQVYRLLRTTDLSSGTIHEQSIPYCASAPPEPDKYLVRPGDIVISRAGSVGLSALVTRDLVNTVFASYLIRFRPLSAVIAEYIAYYLMSPSYWSQVNQQATGITLKNLNAAKLTQFSLSLPPFTEQRRIVAEIEKHLSDLEAAITSTRNAGDRAVSLRSAMLENVFNRPEYPLVPLGTLISSGPQNGIYKPAEAYGTGTPIIRIDDFQDEFLRDRSALRALALEPDELSTYGLRIGDLVINRVNSMTHLGKCFVVPEGTCPAVFESNMMRLSLIPSVTPRWVALYLQSPSGRGRLVQNAKQAVNQASINQRDVCSTPVPMPQSTQEQARQVERLEMHLDSVRAFRTACDLAQARAARLRQAVLHKAFAGKLVPQDPNDEPASVLLERIRAARAQTPARRVPRKREVHA